MRTRSLANTRLFPLLLASVPLILLLCITSWVAAKPLQGTHLLPTCDEAGFEIALAAAAADDDLGMVVFPAGCSGTIALTTSKLIASDIVIDGGGVITLDASASGRHFIVDDGGALILRNITLANGQGESHAGSIWVQGGALTTENVTFVNNRVVDNRAGAILLDGGEGHIRNTTFMQNEGGSSGGAIHALESSLWITASNFLSNSVTFAGAPTMGGAITIESGVETHITASNFVGNQSRLGWGGALFVRLAPLAIADTDFINNGVGAQSDPSTSQGGAIFAHTSSALTIEDARFIENSAAGQGGAIYSTSSTTVITATEFLSNTAVRAGIDQGGAIFFISPQIGSAVTQSTFHGNLTSRDGGAIFNVLTNPTVKPPSIRKSTFSDNRASVSGAAIAYFTIDGVNQHVARIENSTFDGNGGAADDPIAAINLYWTPANLHHLTVTDNDSGILTANSNITITASIFNNIESDCTEEGFYTANYVASRDGTCFGDGEHNLVEEIVLDPLQDNGGLTRTRLPQLGSNVVNAVPVGFCLPTDQREVGRPVDTECEMGAVELAPADAAPATATAEAIATAEAQKTADALATASELATLSAQQTASALTATAAVTADAPTQTPTPTATSTPTPPAPATQTAVVATATALALLTPQASPAPGETPVATPIAIENPQRVFLNPIQLPPTPTP